MTERQRQIMDAIDEFLRTHQYAPSLRDVARAVGMTPNGAIKWQLDRMKKAGYIDWVPNEARTLHVVRWEA